MLENVKAVLFDMDGTLVDSLWVWGEIDIEYLGRHGYEVPSDLQHTIEGMSFSEAAVYFKEFFKLADSAEAIQAEWIEMAKDKYAHEVVLKPGALRFLNHLKEQGIPIVPIPLFPGSGQKSSSLHPSLFLTDQTL